MMRGYATSGSRRLPLEPLKPLPNHCVKDAGIDHVRGVCVEVAGAWSARVDLRLEMNVLIVIFGRTMDGFHGGCDSKAV